MPIAEPKPRYFRTRADFRTWLEKNHASKTELWLLFYKKHTKVKCVSYPEAVEEALCFGWIDGILKSIDGETHKQRFTPRKQKSIWSRVNKNRVIELMKKRLMTPAGMEKVEEAKKSGWWENAYSVTDRQPMPAAFEKAVRADKNAWAYFSAMSESNRNQYIRYYTFAKLDATKVKRLERIIEQLRQNIKPGWWARKEEQ